jgi:hypothetical protein
LISGVQPKQMITDLTAGEIRPLLKLEPRPYAGLKAPLSTRARVRADALPGLLDGNNAAPLWLILLEGGYLFRLISSLTDADSL